MGIILNIDNTVVVKHTGMLGTILAQWGKETQDVNEEKWYEVRTIDFKKDHYKESDLIPDMFQHMEHLPIEVQAVLERYSEMDESYDVCSAMLEEMEALGYTFEYYLDAEPYFLRKKDLVELK